MSVTRSAILKQIFLFIVVFSGLFSTPCMANTPTRNAGIPEYYLRIGTAPSLTADRSYTYVEFIPYIKGIPLHVLPFTLYNDHQNDSFKSNGALLSVATYSVLYGIKWVSNDVAAFLGEGLKYGFIGSMLSIYSGHYNRLQLDPKSRDLYLSYGINLDYSGRRSMYWLEVETGIVFYNLVELSVYHNFGFDYTGIKLGTSILFETD